MKCKSSILLIVLILAAGALSAQQPRLTNGKLETRSAAAGLEKEFNALAGSIGAPPAWIAYAVPVNNPRSSMCCWSNENCGCGLETRNQISGQVNTEQPVKLEGHTEMLVFFRVEQHSVSKIRTFSDDCPLDAGGLTVYWLTGVPPAESVKLLTGFAARGTNDRDRMGNAAVSAIALHKDPAADTALERFVAPDQPEWLRQQTAFWLGVERGRKGYDLLKRMLENDPSEKVRERVIFALTQSKEAEALSTLINTAKNDKSSRVRGQAIFWLGQKAGKKAAGAITEAIENDPDTEVKKRAVFALSQLPKDESVPLLIQVARGNKNPVARKQAMFWLGQSKDPRAVAFFEEILTR